MFVGSEKKDILYFDLMREKARLTNDELLLKNR
jgi:hypothetical protein